jgi:hypothetical protein
MVGILLCHDSFDKWVSQTHVLMGLLIDGYTEGRTIRVDPAAVVKGTYFGKTELGKTLSKQRSVIKKRAYAEFCAQRTMRTHLAGDTSSP